MHRPVLATEVLETLSPKSGGTYIDATVNGGGHALLILEKIGGSGKFLGIDRDCDLIAAIDAKFKKLKIENAKLTCDNFANIESVAGRHHFAKIDGILFDLGFSSYHPEQSGRGFSFLKEEPLDMRYNPRETSLTARTIVNQWPEKEIESILREYGEERFSKKIAEAIVFSRKREEIQTTAALTAIIERAVPRWYCRQRLHCATRTFQALRIVVNNELENIEKGLDGAAKILSFGGKLAAISFHSLEDRIVKRIFREKIKSGKFTDLTKEIVRPSRKEIIINPRARSAKLRAIQKIA